MSTFALDLAKFADKVKGRADDVVGDVVINLYKGVDGRSPVGNRELWAVNIDRKERGLPPVPKGYAGGWFRRNWQLGVDVRPEGVKPGVDPDGSTAAGEILASIPEEAAGKVYYLMNNLPYATRLEEGHSTQAPSGMVGLTAIEFPQMVDQAVAANGGGQ